MWGAQCAVYFPPEVQGHLQFGAFTVSTLSVADLDADVSVRELTLAHSQVRCGMTMCL